MEENKDKLVIDLGILTNSKTSGVAEIALVEEPAIELDFLYFKKEKFVEPTASEEKDEFISRCIGVLVDEGNDADQAAAICYSTWADRFEIDTTGLTPYVDPGVKKKRIEDTYSADQLETILQLASVLGIDEKTVKMESHKFADVPEDSVTLYKYEGRLRDNSRSFCRRLIGLGRFYFKEEIEAMDTMNEEFGPGVGGGQYSIFKYKGGANCGHYWAKYTGFYDENDNWRVVPAEPTSKEQRTAAEAPRTQIGRGYVKRPQRSLSPLALSKLEFKFADDEKRIVVGPAMIPDMEILRRTDDGKPYWVRFSEETIREIAMKYMKEARTNATNTDHETGERAGAYVYESWLVEDPETDKAKTIYGYDVPKGTWMIAMKIDNSETWKRVKAGELKGFSVEGAFADMEEIEAQKQYQKIMDILKGDI